MRCRDVQNNLDRYARGELAPQVRHDVHDHLSSCDPCRAELVRLQQLDALLAAVPLPPIPEGFAGRVVARMQHERDLVYGQSSWIRHLGSRVGGRVRMGAGVVAALAAGLMLGAYLGTDTWRRDPLPATIQAKDPVAGSPLEHFVEPGGDSLVQAYFALMHGNDS